MMPKFRMWHKKRKKMYKMGTHFLSFNWKGWNLISSITGECLVSNKNGILMQSTGLKDLHGKEIFEGDILQVISKVTNPKVVTFELGMFMLENNYLNWYVSHGRHEIIGNIYENPKLLKVKV